MRNYALDELCEVTLIGEERRQNETSGSGSKRSSTTHTEYRCRVELALGQAGEWVFESGEWDRDANRPYRRLLGFSIELARMLEVPWRWQDDGRAEYGSMVWPPGLERARGRAALRALDRLLSGAVGDQGAGLQARSGRIEEMGGQISFSQRLHDRRPQGARKLLEG